MTRVSAMNAGQRPEGDCTVKGTVLIHNFYTVYSTVESHLSGSTCTFYLQIRLPSRITVLVLLLRNSISHSCGCILFLQLFPFGNVWSLFLSSSIPCWSEVFSPSYLSLLCKWASLCTRSRYQLRTMQSPSGPGPTSTTRTATSQLTALLDTLGFLTIRTVR